MGANKIDFEKVFSEITGYKPFRWQSRFYEEWFSKGNIPSYCEVPTGLGKTSIMVLWLIARAVEVELPRRLVYVVDRRAVVDQATRFAERIKNKSEEVLGIKDIPISTLRGKYVDNRSWLEDPTKPAIIVGTVDMIGSRILFSGYGVSSRMRSYHAGMLGADTLFILDEAHLIPPFESLMWEIINNESLKTEKEQIVPSNQILPLSATSRTNGTGGFSLEPQDAYEKVDTVVFERLNAEKRLKVEELSSSTKIEQKLAEKAFERGIENKASRVLVYCDSRKSALKVKKEIDNKLRKKKILGTSELMVGERRVHERERLQEWLEEKGYASKTYRPPDVPTFLVATSAGEVGVDLDSDHIVCDLVPFERMVQRLGRVNRRETKSRTAYIDVFYNAAKDEKEREKKEEYKRLYSCKKVLEKLPSLGTDRYDASPLELSNLKRNGSSGNGLNDVIKDASTPVPLRPRLTRSIVESWALTGIEEHEGRPEIAPWLRGWVDEEPQVEVAWRRWLPWRYGESEPNTNDAEHYFTHVPMHLREVLQAPPDELLATLSSRAQKILEDINKKSKNGEAVISENEPALLFYNKRERLSGSMTLGKLALYQKSKKKKQIEQSITGLKILVSTKIGGLNEDGLLDKSADSVSGLDHSWEEEIKIDIGYISKGPEDSEPEGRIWKRVGTVPLFNPESSESDDIPLISMYVARARNNSREGNRAISSSLQTLEKHHNLIIDYAVKTAMALNLTKNYARILETASRYHDLGKRRKLWQRAMNAPSDDVYAKTNSGADTRLLNGYRHEFGSLYDLKQGNLLETFEKEEQELILHLIAAHHGHARPNIPSFDPEVSLKERQKIAYETSLRYVRLQRKWGVWGLAWWETLLRSIDHAVSSQLDEMGLEENGGDK